jgi:hypothetical protein
VPIRQPITLILGAGASIPYGFPSGRDLVAQALTLNPSNTATRLGFAPGSIASFVADLRSSMSDSIDAFLETREDYLDVGKAVIADLLIPSERSDLLGLTAAPQSRWYDYLWKMLRTPTKEQLRENGLRVVTYNYDRSLEFALLRAVQATYHVTADEAAQLLSCIPIVHVHGTLGQLPGLMLAGSAPTRSYDPLVNLKTIEAAQRSIKIIHENIDDSDELAHARRLIEESSTVVFLGFGFHQRNVERLKLAGSLQGSLRGTIGCEYTRSEIDHVIRPLFADLPADRQAMFTPDARRFDDVLTFLKENRGVFTP